MTEITQDELNEILEKHEKWLNSKPDGEKADLHGRDLQGLDLYKANLQYANLHNANLNYVNLQDANLQHADLWTSDLKGANLQYANLNWTNLDNVDLSYANLRFASLKKASLCFASLRNTNLTGADLFNANLREADLSGATGLLNPIEYIKDNFETTKDGIICYKIFNLMYLVSPNWKIKKGAIIEEEVNYDRTSNCGSGINVGTLDWVSQWGNWHVVWKLLIRWEWLAGVCVPYNTDGKIRCAKAQLIEPIELITLQKGGV